MRTEENVTEIINTTSSYTISLKLDLCSSQSSLHLLVSLFDYKSDLAPTRTSQRELVLS